MKAIEITGDQEFEALTRALAGNGAAAQGSQSITLVALRRRVNRVAADVGVIMAELGRLTSQVDRVADDVGVIKAALIKSSKAPQIRAAKAPQIKAPQIEDIQRVVARHYNTTRDDLLSPRRDARIVYPRAIAMYLARTDMRLSLPEIGRQFGGRDHTTVIHAVKKMEALVETDLELAGEIAEIRAELGEGQQQ